MDAETIAALERAAAGCDKTVALLDLMLSRRPGSTFDASDAATRDQAKADAALIRALIERERAGGERAQIVAYMKGPAIDEAKRKCEAAEKGSKKQRDFAVVAVAVEMLADAIAAGAHKEPTNGR